MPAPPCNLLLVSGAGAGRGRYRRGGRVRRRRFPLRRQGAVVRLAGIAPHYSHLLLHPDSADGLLTSCEPHRGRGTPSTEILLLGRARPRARIGIIRSADRGAVRQALAPLPPMRPWDDKSMHQTELHEALDGATIETPLSADRPHCGPSTGRAGGARPVEPPDPRHAATRRLRAADRGCRPCGASDRPGCRPRAGRHGRSACCAA